MVGVGANEERPIAKSSCKATNSAIVISDLPRICHTPHSTRAADRIACLRGRGAVREGRWFVLDIGRQQEELEDGLGEKSSFARVCSRITASSMRVMCAMHSCEVITCLPLCVTMRRRSCGRYA